MERKRVTPGALYTALNAEFKLLRPAACGGRCRMPLPFPVEGADPLAPNWRVGTPPACVHGCDGLIAQIAARLGPQYELRDPVTTPVKDPATP